MENALNENTEAHVTRAGTGINQVQIAVPLWAKNASHDLWLFRHGRVLNFIWREKWSWKQTAREIFRDSMQGGWTCRKDRAVSVDVHFVSRKHTNLVIPRIVCVVSFYWPVFIVLGAGGSLVIKALGYKPEGRGFETRWGEILNLPNPSGRTKPWGLLSL
jgi:hypothetical protein